MADYPLKLANHSTKMHDQYIIFQKIKNQKNQNQTQYFHSAGETVDR